jgi:hypothetical protein
MDALMWSVCGPLLKLAPRTRRMMGTVHAPSVIVRSLTNFNGAPTSWKELQ